MKVCRECKERYPDTVNICGRDGGELLPAEALPATKILSGVALIMAGLLLSGVLMAALLGVGVLAWWGLLYVRHQKV
jgi:hypothetical protein